jgi:uncharacterized coiled-coil protein SlyX
MEKKGPFHSYNAAGRKRLTGARGENDAGGGSERGQRTLAAVGLGRLIGSTAKPKIIGWFNAIRTIEMTEPPENLVLSILKDIQIRPGRMEERLTNLELRMTGQEQHLGTLIASLPASHDRIDSLTRRIERIERRLELQD